MGVIYKITNPKGKIYIGKSKNLKVRLRRYRMTTLKPDTVIHKSVVKYGWDNHIVEILETLENNLLNEREVFWIAELKTNLYLYPKGNGMNLTQGSDGGNPMIWMNDKEKLCKAVEKRTGINSCRYGIKLSQEMKERIAKGVSISNIKTGRIVPKWGAEKSYSKSRKPVICYDINGDFIGEYISTNHAAKELKIRRREIGIVANGGQTQCHGVLVKFKESDNYPLKIDSSYVKFRSVDKPIVCIRKDNNTVVKEYNTVEEAAIELGIKKNIILVAASKTARRINPLVFRANKRNQYIFLYKDFYSQLKTA